MFTTDTTLGVAVAYLLHTKSVNFAKKKGQPGTCLYHMGQCGEYGPSAGLFLATFSAHDDGERRGLALDRRGGIGEGLGGFDVPSRRRGPSGVRRRRAPRW